MATNKRLIKSNDEGGLGLSFNTVLYTGNGTGKSITGVGFQPDFTWIKNREQPDNHRLVDSVRGATNYLVSNLTNAENTSSNNVVSLDSNGFTVGSAASVNTNNEDYVSWNFKAGGAAVTNTDGTITSQVSANTEAGFSVVSYNKALGSPAASIGHGLNDQPKMIIVKTRDVADTWRVYHTAIGGTQYLSLNETTQALSASSIWNNTDPTTSVFTVGNDGSVGYGNMIAYCFAEVEGFSSFGSYVGTGASGNTVVTGFEPAFVMIKCTSNVMNWAIFDNKRDTTNPNEAILYPNLSLAETNSAGSGINFLANGFELDTVSGGWINASGYSYIYMAFANQF